MAMTSDAAAADGTREWQGYIVKVRVTADYRQRHGLNDTEDLPPEAEHEIMQALRNDAYDFTVRAGAYVDEPENLTPVPEPTFEADGEWDRLLAYDVPADHIEKREAERANADGAEIEAIDDPMVDAEAEVRTWPGFDVERELTEAYRAEHHVPPGQPLSHDQKLAVIQAVRDDADQFFNRTGRYANERADLTPVPDPAYKQAGFWHKLISTPVSERHETDDAEARAKSSLASFFDLSTDGATRLEQRKQNALASFFNRPDTDEGDALPPPDLSADDLAEAAIDHGEAPTEAPADTPVDLPPPQTAPDITAPAATETRNVTGNTVQQPPSPPLSSPVEPTPAPGPIPALGQTHQPYQGGAAPYSPQQQAHRQFDEPGQASGPREPQPALGAAAQEVGALVAAAASGATSLTKGLLSGLMMGLRKPTPTAQEDQQLFLRAAQAAVSSAEIATDKAVEACQAFEACEEVRTWRAKVDNMAQRAGVPPSAIIADMPKRHPDLLDDWKQTLSVPDVADRYRDMTTAVQHHQDAWLSAANAAQQADASPEKYFDHAEPASRRLRDETKAIPTPDGKSTIAETIRKFMDTLQQHVRRLFGLGAAAGSRPAPARP